MTFMNKKAILKLVCAPESPGGLFKHGLLGATPRVSDFVGLGWDLRICLLIKIPRCCLGSWLGLCFEKHWPRGWRGMRPEVKGQVAVVVRRVGCRDWTKQGLVMWFTLLNSPHFINPSTCQLPPKQDSLTYFKRDLNIISYNEILY